MPAARLAHFGASIFSEMSRLSNEAKAVNLGQGFPDFDGPPSIAAAATAAMASGHNQYALSHGVGPLRQAIAEHALRFYGQTVDPDTEVTVTSGATEALFDAVLAFVNPGDEVVLFSPFFDAYLAAVQLAGGVPRSVRLRPPERGHATWWFDPEELKRAFTGKTKLVMLNTPHNPVGKVFTREELALIGSLAEQFNAVIVSDEVYEHLTFGSVPHLRTSTLEGLRDRTITISSGGKSFSFTGWKVGWAIGPAALMQAIRKVHQWVVFSTATPFQHAIAAALRLPDVYFADFKRDYAARKTKLEESLRTAGFSVYPTEGSYFLMANTDRLRRDDEDDLSFCKRLIADAGVAAIPCSTFYLPHEAHHARSLVRFAFCKTDPVLEEAGRRLAAWKR